MGLFKITLTNLEQRLQTLVEGGAARLFPGVGAPQGLSALLEKALKDGIRYGSDGEAVAPDLFFISLYPDHAIILQSDDSWLEELSHSIEQAALKAGLRLNSPPVVRVLPAKDLAPGEVQVLVENSQDELPGTAINKIDREINSEPIPSNTFLIVNGLEVFALSHSVVNIGRRSDNQLVIDDSRVSRLHAQLRFVNGRYVIFDLDSTGGTWVNGQRVHQQVLVPGDVISLAGVMVVYGQETPNQDQTQDYIPNRS